MHDWFRAISEGCSVPAKVIRDLDDIGFIVIPDAVTSDDLPQLALAYDSAFASASLNDKKIGSFTTRVNGFLNHGAEFDALYVYQPLLEASCYLIGQPFKLSSLHARTLHPNSQAQGLHIDFKMNEERFPMAGFILMVDDFRNDNGATRFVPGSHKWTTVPNDLPAECLEDYENQTVPACGQAGSMIVFNGSIWHGHSANITGMPRRSLQGAYIPHGEQAGIDFQATMPSETATRLSPLAKYLLVV